MGDHNLASKHFPHLQSQSEKGQTEMYQLFEASKRAYLSMMTPWWQTPLSFQPNHLYGDTLSLRFHQLHSYLSNSMYATSNVLPLVSHSPTTNYGSLKVKDKCCSAHVEEHKDVDQSQGKESILSAIKKSGKKLSSVLKGHAPCRFSFTEQIPAQIFLKKLYSLEHILSMLNNVIIPGEVKNVKEAVASSDPDSEVSRHRFDFAHLAVSCASTTSSDPDEPEEAKVTSHLPPLFCPSPLEPLDLSCSQMSIFGLR